MKFTDFELSNKLVALGCVSKSRKCWERMSEKSEAELCNYVTYCSSSIKGFLWVKHAFIFSDFVDNEEYVSDNLNILQKIYASNAKKSGCCNHCGEDIFIRNPTGKCDHLYYPDNCVICMFLNKPKLTLIEADDWREVLKEVVK